jgi:hypothetical protein
MVPLWRYCLGGDPLGHGLDKLLARAIVVNVLKISPPGKVEAEMPDGLETSEAITFLLAADYKSAAWPLDCKSSGSDL